MKFMCLPGGFSNAKTLRVQLMPLLEELESDDSASFCFTQGSYETTPPPGFENYFGAGPHYRFTRPETADNFETEVIKAVRALPQMDSPEDSLRKAIEGMPQRQRHGMQEAIDSVREAMDREGGVQGLIGYSEGAMVAASVILDEQRRRAANGEEPRVRCAVFISGWPPFDCNTGSIVLADETEECLGIPTCHVIGAADPMLCGAMALFNLCDEDTAELFDHGAGHMVPRSPQALKELGQVVRDMMASA